ncbi:MAG: mechanosensitive ion channel [Ruminococcus sp.]|nr:mechanosensitive ion channel [Ruminococcus sp.]
MTDAELAAAAQELSTGFDEETAPAEASEAPSEETTYETIQEQVSHTASVFNSAGRYLRGVLPSLIMAVVIFIIGVVIVKLLTRLLTRSMKRSNIDGAARSFLVSLIRIMLYMVVLIMALTVLKVPMSSIITILGAAGLAVSLALQTCLSNLCGGFIILFSKPFVAGDMVELDGTVGVVESISILYTKIVTPDHKTVFIPNGKVSEAKVINYTESPTRRIDLVFDISYTADYTKAREVILGAAAQDKLILTDPKPIVRMRSHNDSSVSIDVLVWAKNEDWFTARYNMVEAVKSAFDENGIEIPFPQLDVHMK